MIDKIKIICDLIRMKTVTSDVAAVNKATDYIHSILEKHGVYCQLEERNGRKILFASTQPGKTQDILFNAHIDVVPAPDKMFEPRMEGTILHGRGSDDDLSSAACLIELLCNNRNCGGSLGCIFTTNEETGGTTTKYMIDKGYQGKRLAIILDGNTYSVEYGHKGVLVLRLTAESAGGHSSEPWNYQNPMDQLIDGYTALRKAWDHPTKEDSWKPSLTATIFNAGEADNVIPQKASIVLNIRYTELDQKEKILALVEEKTGIKPVVEFSGLPVLTDKDSPEIKLFFNAIQKYFPRENIFLDRGNGSTDARHMTGMGVPMIISGVVGGECHGDHEWSDTSKLDPLVHAIQEVIDEILKK